MAHTKSLLNPPTREGNNYETPSEFSNLPTLITEMQDELNLHRADAERCENIYSNVQKLMADVSGKLDTLKRSFLSNREIYFKPALVDRHALMQMFGKIKCREAATTNARSNGGGNNNNNNSGSNSNNNGGDASGNGGLGKPNLTRRPSFQPPGGGSTLSRIDSTSSQMNEGANANFNHESTDAAATEHDSRGGGGGGDTLNNSGRGLNRSENQVKTIFFREQTQTNSSISTN